MFIKFRTVDSNNKATTYIVNGEYNTQLTEEFTKKIKSFSGEKDLVKVRLIASDCFTIKNGKNKELQEIVKKFF